MSKEPSEVAQRAVLAILNEGDICADMSKPCKELPCHCAKYLAKAVLAAALPFNPAPETRQERAKPAASDLDVAKSVYKTIELFGWSILWRSPEPIPDDAWPIDIIAAALTERGRVERERAAEIVEADPHLYDGEAIRIAAAIRNQGD